MRDVRIYGWYASKLIAELKFVSTLTGYSKLYHFFDYISAFILHGCSINQYGKGNFYSLKEFARKKTITCKRSFKIWKVFNDIRYIRYFESKMDFNRCFSDYILREWVYSRDDELVIRNFISKHNYFIIKPIGLLQGQGVECIDRSKIDVDRFILNIKNKNLLLEECIKQHPYMMLNSKSVNTVRVYSLLDKKGKVHILKALLRAGKGDSVIDNFCADGCLYSVDIETGLVDERGIDRMGNIYLSSRL